MFILHTNEPLLYCPGQGSTRTVCACHQLVSVTDTMNLRDLSSDQAYRIVI